MSIILATILGLSFGFVLQKSGAANPQRIIDMLCLKDFHLMKTIALAIGLSSFALFFLLTIGAVDTANLGVKSSYIGVIIGGAILGLGWTISGFCPGTGVVAAGTGRKDALFFILGGLLGTFVFTLIYSSLKTTFLFNDFGGKLTLASTGNPKFEAFFSSAPAFAVAGGIAITFIVIAWMLPARKSI